MLKRDAAQSWLELQDRIAELLKIREEQDRQIETLRSQQRDYEERLRAGMGRNKPERHYVFGERIVRVKLNPKFPNQSPEEPETLIVSVIEAEY